MSKCKVCSPRTCRPGYLYVIWDGRLGLSKIGQSVNVSARLAKYRANGADYMELQHKRVAGCPWSVTDREAKALRLLASRAPRIRGDWFDCLPETAIACVEEVCAGYKGTQWL